MKKYIAVLLIFLPLTSYALVANGVRVYLSNVGPGAAGVYANGSMIRFLNNTNQAIQCGVTHTASGQWLSTAWLKPNYYADLPLPTGQYTWHCVF